MTRNEIIQMARRAGMAGMLTDIVTTSEELERFAALVEAEVCKQHEARIAELEAALAIPHAAFIRSGLGVAVQCAIGSIKDAEKFKAALDAARARFRAKAVTA